MTNVVSTIGGGTLRLTQVMGRAGLFLVQGLYQGLKPPFRLSRLVKEIEFIGARSVLIVTVTALFTGMVLALQGYYTLSKFGSQGLLGSAVALSIIRELGPVLCALMVTGRAGSAMTAEIGIMKITDQVPALEMMSVDPVGFVISPKLLAGILAVPVLTGFFDLVGIFGGYLVGVQLLGVNEGAYFGEMISATTFTDIYSGFVKSITFGLIIAWFSTFVGYTATPTTEGVSTATTTSVVLTSLTILITDYVLTSVLL